MRHRVVLLALVFFLILATALAPTAHAIIPYWGATFTVGSKMYGVWYDADWHYYPMDTAPVVKNGRIYVPIRYMTEAYNRRYVLFIDFCQNSVVLYRPYPRLVVTMAVGSTVLVVNDRVYWMDAAPFIKNGRMMVPVRWIAQALGLAVEGGSRGATVYEPFM